MKQVFLQSEIKAKLWKGLLIFFIQGTWELWEAEEAAAEPRGGEQGAEEGGEGGKEEEGWIWLRGKLKVVSCRSCHNRK